MVSASREMRRRSWSGLSDGWPNGCSFTYDRQDLLGRDNSLSFPASHHIGFNDDAVSQDMSTLSRPQARQFYDWMGSKLDLQAFCEDRATAELTEHLDLGSAEFVFEFGCGTGRFAESLLARHLSRTAIYHAVDISPVMVGLARERLKKFGPRANVRITDGRPSIDEASESHDRFISNFVLDLLSEDDIENVLREAHRLLCPGGLLGLSSQTPGFTLASR